MASTGYVLQDASGPIVSNASGVGIQVGTPATHAFGWRDITGSIEARDTGPTAPSWATFIGGIKQYQFSVNDEAGINFHMPHDWVPGTDIHIHFHWAHAATVVTGGTVTWGAEVTWAKGFNQAPFQATITTTVVGNASTTQYQHIVTETQLTAASPTAAQIDTDNLEVDGVFLCRVYLSANDLTFSGGGLAPEPFLHFVDLHYQSTGMATKNKSPNFYT
jgi:hypothetical protein